MKTFFVDASALISASIAQEEITALELLPGEPLCCRGKVFTWSCPVVLLVDRFCDGSCTAIRQVLSAEPGAWDQAYIEPNAEARLWAKQEAFPRIRVPGGIYPLTPEGCIAVPDFNLCGNTWYIVPESALCAHVSDYQVRYHYAIA